jgi:hypothetical protein
MTKIPSRLKRPANKPKATRATRLSAPAGLPSLLRGLYGRVATKLKLDPSYVSRVARGERHSPLIESELRQELNKILRKVSRASKRS